MKKELREQIKHDEFASGLEKAAAWAGEHRDELRIGLGVAVVLAAVVGGIVWTQGRKAQEADQAFRDALTTFEAPVASELPPGAERPSGAVFPSEEEKYKTAAAAFDGVARRFGSSTIGLRAKYYAAICRIELKQYPDAEKALGEISSRGAGLVPELARLALANAYRRSGQVDKAVEAYQGMASDASAAVPRDFALMSAAQTLDDAKQWAKARATYQQLVEEFPASVYASQARARASYLQNAGRG